MKTPQDDPSSIGNILLRMQLITQRQLDEVKEEQAQMQEDLLMGNLMVARGLITNSQLDIALAAQQGLRLGGKSGEALAVAEVSLKYANADRDRRTRVVEKGVVVEQNFLRFVATRHA